MTPSPKEQALPSATTKLWWLPTATAATSTPRSALPSTAPCLQPSRALPPSAPYRHKSCRPTSSLAWPHRLAPSKLCGARAPCAIPRSSQPPLSLGRAIPEVRNRWRHALPWAPVPRSSPAGIRAAGRLLAAQTLSGSIAARSTPTGCVASPATGPLPTAALKRGSKLFRLLRHAPAPASECAYTCDGSASWLSAPLRRPSRKYACTARAKHVSLALFKQPARGRGSDQM